jgi:NhaP-type Na+/H+ or K+/H+ antiporter
MLTHSYEDDTVGALGLLLLLVAFVVWLSHLTRSVIWVTQGSLALFIGLVAGGISWVVYEGFLHRHVPQALVAFNYEIYMDLLLPIIIYQMGFSTKKHSMFSNLGALMTLGVLGTILSAILISTASYYLLIVLGLDEEGLVPNSLALGIILSSTDSVAALQAINKDMQPQLHALTFGEGVFNDATAIVLLRSIQNIHSFAQMDGETMTIIMFSFVKLLVLSLLLGFGMGLLTAFVLKQSFSSHNTHSTDREVSILFLLGLSSYLIAERLGLSGVFSVFFCGLTQSHYAWYNLSASAKVVSIYLSRVMSFVAEIMLFLFCGLDLYGSWDAMGVTKASVMDKILIITGFLTVFLILVRFMVTLPLIRLIHTWRPEKIHHVESYMLCLAGCARGAVTLALSMNHFLGGNHEVHKNERILSAACIFITIVSTMGLGSIIPLVFEQWQESIGVSNAAKGDGHALTGRLSRVTTMNTVALPDISNIHNTLDVRKLWTYVDRKYIQPCFGGRVTITDEEHPPSPGRWRGVHSTLRIMQQDMLNRNTDRNHHATVTMTPSPFVSRVAEDGTDLHAAEQLSSVSSEILTSDAAGEQHIDLLEPLFSMLGERQASKQAEIRIDSLLGRALEEDNA